MNAPAKDPIVYLSGVHNEAIVERAQAVPRIGLMAQPRSAVFEHISRYPAGAAYDNGAFGAFLRGTEFDVEGWRRGLARVPTSLLFAVAPDVVGDHEATRKAWPEYAGEIIERGLRPAFVLQNGCRDLTQVPADAGAVFIGGDNAYKLGPDAARVCWQARQAGCWVHMGRVNSWKRFRRAVAMGCDSADGTFLRFGPIDLMLDRLCTWLAASVDLGAQLDLTEQAS